MGRAPCCEKQGLKKGPWSTEEDEILVEYIKKSGHGSWRSLPKLAGLLRCGKSCRLRWTNYLRPDIKRGPFTPEEETTIIQLHGIMGNRWSSIASQLPGRTDNEIKNFWNTHLKKRLVRMGLNPASHAASSPPSSTGAAVCSAVVASSPATRHMAQWESARLEAEARLSREAYLSAAGEPCAAGAVLKPFPDYFLRIWNSDVGLSFRRVCASRASNTATMGEWKTTAAQEQRPVSPASSSTTMAGGAPPLPARQLCRSEKEDPVAGSEESSTTEFDDSSESSLQILLDFPVDEVNFLQGQVGFFPMFPGELRVRPA